MDPSEQSSEVEESFALTLVDCTGIDRPNFVRCHKENVEVVGRGDKATLDNYHNRSHHDLLVLDLRAPRTPGDCNSYLGPLLRMSVFFDVDVVG